jgi:hypothetical protein
LDEEGSQPLETKPAIELVIPVPVGMTDELMVILNRNSDTEMLASLI